MLDSDFDNDILKIKLKAKSAQAIAGPWRARTVCCVEYARYTLFILIFDNNFIIMIIVVLGLCSTDEECEKDMTGYRCFEGYCRLGCVCP